MLAARVRSELIKPKPDAKVVQWIDGTVGSVVAGGPSRPLQGRILPINEAIADRWGAISAAAAAKGKPVPVIDGLLAATALHHDLMLATRNASDVAATGVAVLNPWL